MSSITFITCHLTFAGGGVERYGVVGLLFGVSKTRPNRPQPILYNVRWRVLFMWKLGHYWLNQSIASVLYETVRRTHQNGTPDGTLQTPLRLWVFFASMHLRAAVRDCRQDVYFQGIRGTPGPTETLPYHKVLRHKEIMICLRQY